MILLIGVETEEPRGDGAEEWRVDDAVFGEREAGSVIGGVGELVGPRAAEGEIVFGDEADEFFVGTRFGRAEGNFVSVGIGIPRELGAVGEFFEADGFHGGPPRGHRGVVGDGGPNGGAAGAERDGDDGAVIAGHPRAGDVEDEGGDGEEGDEAEDGVEGDFHGVGGEENVREGALIWTGRWRQGRIFDHRFRGWRG